MIGIAVALLVIPDHGVIAFAGRIAGTGLVVTASYAVLFRVQWARAARRADDLGMVGLVAMV